MNLVIEKNIPIPTKKRNSLSDLHQALMSMKVGDSFLYHNNQSPYVAAREVGRTIKTQKISGSGFRVWLISKTRLPISPLR